LPFEATISLLFTADAPGVPKPVKLERRHRDLVPLDRQIDESVGAVLAAWAAGTPDSVPASLPKQPRANLPAINDDAELEEEAIALTDLMISVGEERGTREKVEKAIRGHQAGHSLSEHVEWLKGQRDRALATTEEVTS
jgi:hypothetical protein